MNPNFKIRTAQEHFWKKKHRAHENPIAPLPGPEWLSPPDRSTSFPGCRRGRKSNTLMFYIILLTLFYSLLSLQKKFIV